MDAATSREAIFTPRLAPGSNPRLSFTGLVVLVRFALLFAKVDIKVEVGQMFDWKAAIPWLLSLLAVAAGIWQYADKQAQANREPFLRKQLDLIFEASDTVSVLANSTDAQALKRARDRFWVLYWGPLGIVEDNRIARCMVEAGKIVPQPSGAAPELPITKLQATSLRLSHVARDFILENWDVELPKLQPAVPGTGGASCG